MQSFRGNAFVWLCGLVLSVGTYAKMDGPRRLPPKPLPTVTPKIPSTPIPATDPTPPLPRPGPSPKATQAPQTSSSDPCNDPALSYEEKARRGCCENSASRGESQGLNNYCQTFGPRDEMSRRSTQDIWKNELERRRKMACGESEQCPCMAEKLSPDIAAQCANAISIPSETDDSFAENISNAWDQISHPIKFIPGLDGIGDKVKWSYGKGPSNNVNYHENETSKVWIQIKLY